MQPINMKTKYIVKGIIGLVLLIGLYFVSRVNYTFFHSFSDMLVIFIAASVFVIIWSGRHLLDNQYYLFVSIAFLFFALFNFLHLLGNKGMVVFPEYGNLGPAFYIIERYLLSISLLLAPLFIRRRIKTAFVFAAYSVVSILLLLSVFYWKNFPVTYIEGVGLTPFKIVSDYIADFILLASIGFLLLKRQAFDAKIFRYIVWSQILSVLTGLAFTLYTDPFGIMNVLGHFLLIASFMLIYMAFVDTGLAKPQNILFHSLLQSNEEIRKLNSDLQRKNFELEKTDAALKESELQTNYLIQYAPTAIFEIDYLAPRFISANDAMCRMSGYTREELLAVDSKTLLGFESGRAMIEAIQLELAGERSNKDHEFQFTTKDGSPIYMVLYFSFPANKSGTAFVVGHDISARKIYEEKLKESEERFRTLSETSPVGVVVTSTDGVLIYTNQAYESILGFDHNELLGSHAVDRYMNPEERSRWIGQLNTDGSIRNVEIRLKKKDGQPLWTLISATPILYGGTQALMGTVQDINDRKKTEDDLKRYADDLEVSNKELEAFAYSLSHDLRAPLRALDGFSQAVLDEYDDKLDDTGRDYLNRIRGAAQNMAQITEDMLKLSHVIRNELHLETVSISEMVHEIAQGLGETDPARKSEFIIEPNVTAVGDRSLLHIALYNLIENAWKFSADSPLAKIEFATATQGKEKVYCVKDNGIGFDMQFADKLFQPFQRLHVNDFKGHGIGLATVQRVIRRHGGDIWADSEMGNGTVICFTLGERGGLYE